MNSRLTSRGTILLVVALLSMNFAWSQSVSVSSPGTPTVYGTFSVDVNFSNVANIMGSHVVVTFDPTKMQYTGVSKVGSVFTQDPYVNSESGQLTVDQATFGAALAGSSGKLFTINFTALQAVASTDIAVPTVTFRDPSNVTIAPPTSGSTQAVTINNPAPTLTSIDPATLTADHGVVTLTLTGSNFVTGSSVQINSKTYALSSFDSKTQVKINIPAEDLKTANEYPVTVTNAAPGGGTSGAVTLTVTAGAAANLTKTSGEPQSATVKSILSPFVVTVTDLNNNPVSGTTVSFEIYGTPVGSSGSSISTISATTGANGQASTTLTLGNKSGTYTVRATSSGLTGSPADFSSNATAGLADKLAFLQQPTSTTSGVTISPAVTVQILDVDGNLTSDTRDVTLVFGTNLTGATLGGTTTKTAVGGTATFNDLSIVKAGTGYTLVASAVSVTGATSEAFNITAGAAAKIVLTSGDLQTAAINTALTNPLVVTVTDAADNPVQGTSVTFAIASAPTDATGQLLGTTSTTTNASGQASTTLTLGNKAGDYTVDASSGSLTGSPVTFHATATAGTATKLTFGVQPSSTTSGTAIAPAVIVRIEDVSGNLVTSGSYNVTIAISSNAGGGTLSGTQTVLSSGGLATFSTLSIDKAGTGYKLGATSDPALASAVSSEFNITPGLPAKLAFGAQPSKTAAGSTMSPVTVRIEDAAGNLTTDTRTVTIALGNNPDGAGSLSGTLMNAAVGGVATFGDLSITKAATGYTLTGSAGSVTGATSVAFDIDPAAYDHLVFAPVSTPQASGTPFNITVTAVDAYLNTVTSYATSATLSATGGTISPLSANYVAGVLKQAVTITGNPMASASIKVTDALGHEVTSNSFALVSAPKLFVAVSAADTTKRIHYPMDSWSTTANEPNDWSIKTSPIVSFSLVPQQGMVFSSYDVTVTWDATALQYLRTVRGNVGGSTYDTSSTANTVRIHNNPASADNPPINTGDSLARIDFAILKPGFAAVQVSNATFNRNILGPFVVTPNDGSVKAYLGDVTTTGKVDSTGDGLVEWEDLALWSLSYWSGVPGYVGTNNYKVKYDIGPTLGNHYVYTMPEPDGKIEFEDLIIFSISYGLSKSGGYSKVSAAPTDTVGVSLGQPMIAGNETRVPVVLDGNFSDVRAMSLVVDGRFGKFLGAEKGTLLQSYQTPVMVMSRSTERQAFVDLSVVGSNVEGLSRPGEVVVLRFEGTPQIKLIKNIARNSENMVLPVQKLRGAGEAVPTEFTLLQNYPNPFNPTTMIEYQLAAQTMTDIQIYNMLGERVATLVHEVQPAGFYTIKWNGTGDSGAKVATGVYFYRMVAGKFSIVKKMLLVK
jgi:hypothetical protein